MLQVQKRLSHVESYGKDFTTCVRLLLFASKLIWGVCVPLKYQDSARKIHFTMQHKAFILHLRKWKVASTPLDSFGK